MRAPRKQAYHNLSLSSFVLHHLFPRLIGTSSVCHRTSFAVDAFDSNDL